MGPLLRCQWVLAVSVLLAWLKETDGGSETIDIKLSILARIRLLPGPTLRNVRRLFKYTVIS